MTTTKILKKIKKIITESKKSHKKTLNSILISCVNLDFVEGIKLMLSSEKFNISLQDNSIFFMASKLGKIEIVKFLLHECEADPSQNNNEALIGACFFGKIDIVEILLKDPRVDPTDRGQLAFEHAYSYNHPILVELLLNDSRIDPTINNQYCLLHSVLLDHKDVSRVLLQDNRIGFPEWNKDKILSELDTNTIYLLNLLLEHTDSRINLILADDAFCKAIYNNNENLINCLLNTEDLCVLSDIAINVAYTAVQLDRPNIFKLIIKDERVHKVDFVSLFKLLYDEENHIFSQILWKEKWLRNQIEKQDPKTYQAYFQSNFENKIGFF